MNRNEIRQRINSILFQNGVFIDEKGTQYNNFLDIDSLTYVSILVDVETEFGFEIDNMIFFDENIMYSEFVNKLTDMIEVSFKK